MLSLVTEHHSTQCMYVAAVSVVEPAGAMQTLILCIPDQCVSKCMHIPEYLHIR